MDDYTVRRRGPTGGRWAALGGLGFVVLFGIAAALYGSGAGSNQQEISAYYADPSSRIHQIEGFAALLLASVFLLIYVALLTRQTVHDTLMSDVATISGAATVIFLMLANALWAATAFTVDIQGSYAVSANSHLLVEDAAFVCLVTAMVAAIPWVLLTSFSGVRSGRMPRWFAGLGILAALGETLAYWYLPLAGFLLWVLAGSVILVRTHVEAHPRRGPATSPADHAEGL